MNTQHEQYKEWLQLFLYDELNPAEKKSLDKHLLTCAECQLELTQLQKLHSTLANREMLAPTEEMLFEARRELKASLRLQYKKTTMWDWLYEQLKATFFPNVRFVFGSVATLAIGFALGYYFMFPAHPANQPITGQTLGEPAGPQNGTPTSSYPFTTTSGNTELASNTLPTSEGEAQISNVRFIDSDVSDGQVEFLFDALTPVRMKGNVNDPRIQKVLTHALLNEQNPGVRLRSANAMEQVTMKTSSLEDNSVKDALITALTTDKNSGVRREALDALKRFPLDEQIKQALLHVLTQDDNSALRIDAINILENSNIESKGIDQDILNVLKNKVKTDDNDYIRQRAKAVLKEVRQ